MKNKTFYDILGVTSDADDVVIRAAYIALMRKFHPDINPAGTDRARDIGEAFLALGRPESRADYDRQLGIKTAVAKPTPPHRGTGVGPRLAPRPTRKLQPLSGGWFRPSTNDYPARRNGWLLPTTGLLIATTSLIATYSLVDGAALGIDTNEVAIPGEEGISNVIVAPAKAGTIAGLSIQDTSDPARQSATVGQVAAFPSPVTGGEVVEIGTADLAPVEQLMTDDIIRAVDKFMRVNGDGGAAAVRAFSAKCDRGANRVNTLQARDYCVAFDYAAQRLASIPLRSNGTSSLYRLRMTGASASAKTGTNEIDADPVGSRFAMIKQIIEREALPLASGSR